MQRQAHMNFNEISSRFPLSILLAWVRLCWQRHPALEPETKHLEAFGAPCMYVASGNHWTIDYRDKASCTSNKSAAGITYMASKTLTYLYRHFQNSISRLSAQLKTGIRLDSQRHFSIALPGNELPSHMHFCSPRCSLFVHAMCHSQCGYL